MKILTLTTLFPNKLQPIHGIFIKKRIEALAKFAEIKVVAPVPWVPFSSSKYSIYSQIPVREIESGLEVFHPRYVIAPKIGRPLYGFMYFLSIYSFIKNLAKSYNFDLLDVHWAYPDGFAGVLLAKSFKKPVIITVRGTDINLYPKYFLRRRLIIYALKKADKIISVCEALKKRVINLGINESKTVVIPNGIDTKLFYHLDKLSVRKILNLPLNKKIILSIGHLVELKGFHYVIEAIHKLITIHKLRNILLLIIGEGPYRKKLESKIKRLNLNNYVRLIGQIPNEKLVYWYNAADVFCLASSREGWPNVLFESLACGTPVVTTAVGGIPEIICSDKYGILVKSQDSEELAKALKKALEKNWDIKAIVNYARKNTWENVAKNIYYEFKKIIDKKYV